MNAVNLQPNSLREDLSQLGNFDKLPGEYRDPKESQESVAYLEHQSTIESNARSYPRKLPFALQSAKGIFLKDVDNHIYYDCLSGAGALALGHNHQVVQDAIMEQLQSNLPMLTLDITTPVKQKFTEDILSCFPKEFAENAKVQFCGPSGADAVEAALKLVKIATGKSNIMAFHGAYHGMTNGTLSLMGNIGTKQPIPNLMPAANFLPYPYTYRNPMGGEDDIDGTQCSRYIETMLNDDESGIDKPAAIILEAIQGEGGKIPAPKKFMQELRRITKEKNIPLIIDEIQSGLGRTGKMFAFEDSGIIPDVVVLSKAIGGSLPLAVVVYNKDLDGWKPGSHAGTFRGNQLAMAAGSATIQYIKDENLLDHVSAMGELFFERLRDIQSRHACIGDVRGRGLMIGLEIVQPTGEAKPERYEKLARRIQFECFCRGLIIEIGGRQTSVIRLLPPLIITEEQVIHICEILETSIKAAIEAVK